MSKNIIFSGLTSALLLACGGKPDVGTLQTIQDDIAQALPTVRHISADKLEALINNNDDELLVLDIRPLAEYNVSRIKGALQLDPDIKPEYLSASFTPMMINGVRFWNAKIQSPIAQNRLA